MSLEFNRDIKLIFPKKVPEVSPSGAFIEVDYQE